MQNDDYWTATRFLDFAVMLLSSTFRMSKKETKLMLPGIRINKLPTGGENGGVHDGG